MSSIGLVAFDLDGTLVDSAADLARAVQCMAAELGLAPPHTDEVRRWVGDGVRRLVKRALSGGAEAEPPAALYEMGFQAFRRAYRAGLAVDSRLYPGAREVLQWAQDRGLALACITNKSGEFTLPLLEALEIRNYFGLVLSGDSLAVRKPDPGPLLQALHHFQIGSADACMVGDSRNDVLAARAAGYLAVGVCYGYGRDLSALQPDALLSALPELPPWLEKRITGLADSRASRYV